MLIDADLRGKIWADKTFIQSVLQLEEQSSSDVNQEVVSDPSDFSFNAFAKPLTWNLSLSLESSEMTSRLKNPFHGVFTASTILLNEILSKYRPFLKYLYVKDREFAWVHPQQPFPKVGPI